MKVFGICGDGQFTGRIEMKLKSADTTYKICLVPDSIGIEQNRSSARIEFSDTREIDELIRLLTDFKEFSCVHLGIWERNGNMFL